MTSTVFRIVAVVVVLLQKCCTHLVAGRIYYIKSSVSIPCLEEPCLTLLQFAAHFKNHLESNVSLIFLPGYHTLDSRLSFHAVSQFSMHPDSTLSPSPGIFCQRQAGITVSSINDVYIDHLKFVGCHSHQVTAVNRFVLEDVSFLNHTGSALQFSSSNADIIRCSFISNLGDSNQRRPRKLAENDYPFSNYNSAIYAMAGAAVVLAESNIDILDSLFKGNHAEMGGAVFSEQHSNITLVNTIFERNYAQCGISGGSICIGGALYSEAGTVLAYNSTFYGNKLIFIEGGLRDRIFPYGGVVGLFHSTFIVENCKFVNNGLDYSSKYGYGGVVHAYNTVLNITDSNFMSNGNTSIGGVVSLSSSTCSVTYSNFTNSSATQRGGVIYSDVSSITLSNSKFKYSFFNSESVANGLLGGVLYTLQTDVSVVSSVFEGNKGYYGGVVYVKGDIYMIITSSNFSRNRSTKSGGVLHMERLGVHYIVTIFVVSSIFNDNSAGTFGGGMAVCYSNGHNNNVTLDGVGFLRNKARLGGAILLYSVKPVFISDSKFVENIAPNGGAIACLAGSNVTIEGGTIESNEARIGVIYASTGTSVRFFNAIIINNTANRAVMYVLQSVGYFSDTLFANNTGSVFVQFGNLTFSGAISITNGSPQLSFTSAQEEVTLKTFPEGGAVTAIQAIIAIEGVYFLCYNYAESGGAFYASESRVHIYGETTIAHNAASNSGGGIYLHQSGLTCYSQCTLELVNNTSGYKGGGIYATSSFFSAENEAWVTFKENNAGFAGGGICLEQNSRLYVLMVSEGIGKVDVMIFTGNSADYGGALYVADETNSGTCASKSFEQYSTKTECFIELLPHQSGYYGNNNIDVTVFENNHAYIAGSDLFGGLLDRCTISPLAAKDSSRTSIIDGTSYFLDIGNIEQLVTISSAPVRVCFCNEDKQPVCGYHPPIINVKKGETFTVSLVAVDQVNRTVSNVTIRSHLSSALGGLGEDRQNQSTGQDCSDLMFEVFSPHSSEQLILYADGPCKDAPLSQGIVNINFSSCDCPVGFQQKVAMKTKCECECDSDLWPYVSNCDYDAETITREGDWWIGYVESSKGYLIHPHCPFDYCKPSSEKIAINLNTDSGANVQCANNRSGILCGRCSVGTSLSIDSSHCKQCPTYWPLLTITLLTVSILAGILLVALVLSLNLTVAVGTLNGVIFYANIVAANTNAVFPPNMIIAWLNLEPGINTCFFDGMTTYWKTWLQLVFPAYVIFLVVVVILISERSRKFARLIGKKDPVATLATLVLFSYAKLLHAIIASLSGTVLKYPGTNGTRDDVAVWLPDASIKYLSAKHIPLFIIAILILLAGIVYTLMLFFWQWFLRFKSLNCAPKFSLFIQVYHAPYTPKHRYWTGLLLVVRIILYIVFAANVKSDPKINLIAVGVVVVSILIVRDFVKGRGQLYQKQPIELLEIACHFNLVILCIVTFFTLEDSAVKNIFAQTSMSVTIVLLLGVLLYHLFTEVVLKSKLWKQFTKGREQHTHEEIDTVMLEDSSAPKPTHSVIESPKQVLRGRKRMLKNVDAPCELKEILLDQGDANYVDL